MTRRYTPGRRAPVQRPTRKAVREAIAAQAPVDWQPPERAKVRRKGVADDREILPDEVGED